MIGLIKGEMVDAESVKNKHTITIFCGGLGHIVNVSHDSKQGIGLTVKFYIKQIIAENKNDLYGFTCKKDKKMFEDLLTVDRMGPSSAMIIKGRISTDKIRACIVAGNFAEFTKIKGIGPKSIQSLKDVLQKKYIGEQNNVK
jgi:Holliday junction DNA helicase RuvA